MVPVLMAIAPILIAAPLAAVLYVVVWFGVGKLVDPGSVKGVLALVRKEKPAPA